MHPRFNCRTTSVLAPSRLCVLLYWRNYDNNTRWLIMMMMMMATVNGQRPVQYIYIYIYRRSYYNDFSGKLCVFALLTFCFSVFAFEYKIIVLNATDVCQTVCWQIARIKYQFAATRGKVASFVLRITKRVEWTRNSVLKQKRVAVLRKLEFFSFVCTQLFLIVHWLQIVFVYGLKSHKLPAYVTFS